MNYAIKIQTNLLLSNMQTKLILFVVHAIPTSKIIAIVIIVFKCLTLLMIYK